jgi:3-phenylpropionate/trans-cinnamate dioxygenase ferredoxin component
VAEFVRAASLSDVPPGTLLAVEVGGQRVCLANVDGVVYAMRDNCSHRDFPLSAGELDDGEVTCNWHGARFDVRSGRALALPAIRPVATYEVRLEGDEIHVAVG